MSFQELQLAPALLRAVAASNYTTPTEIQRRAIPVALQGRDLVASAQTGTGKTAAFVLPALQRLLVPARARTTRGRRPRMLVLTPTRELASQVAESVRTYGKNLPFRSAVIYGGVNIYPQIKALQAGVDIVVATPGRLLDHASQKTVNLSGIEILVLDEADRMLDMGFIQDIRKILSLLPPKRQNLLFSATFPDEIRQLADRMMNSPERIEAARRTIDAEGVTQAVHLVDRERKRELLSHLVRSRGWKQVLVFTRTKHGANRLSEQLERDGITSSAIHGNKSQPARAKALADFKKGLVRVLVATDVASRGLDINRLPQVVNFELPHVPEDYVHRIGRTGRAGQSGQALSLVCVDEHKLLADIGRLLKRNIPVIEVPGFRPDPSVRPEPIRKGRNSAGRGQAKKGWEHSPGPKRPGRGRGNKRPQRSAHLRDRSW